MKGNHKFFHGTLEATIFHATPYIPPPFPFNCLPKNKAAYVTITIEHKKVAKTQPQPDRIWNQTFEILCAYSCDTTITITMRTRCSILGKIDISVNWIMKEVNLIDGYFPLVMENGKTNHDMKLRFMLWFKPAEIFRRDGEFKGIRNSTFSQHSNCHVTLYQDAHHCSSFQPPFDLHGSPRKLWEDVYRAIERAKHLIYIAGWSVNPNIVLVRDPETEIPHAFGVKLGELLKQKAEEGVAVRIMLWNDETSLPFFKNKGLMDTHDQDALAYFRHTKVICKLCPRLHFHFPTVFAHHQKTISVDIDREIMSFIGGLDLCDGRYDTEEHSLFHTLNKESHYHDFYQPNIACASLHNGGPRDPWHDVHACVTGEAARDILSNFEQRWSKQCDPSLLIPISFIAPSISLERDWKVQVFRSIDHVSTTVLPKHFDVERSIHEAYVYAIRRAEKFIYIENQYFIGGCHLWEKDQQSGCTNLIPIEIALKVVSKIKSRERFAVYILIPMWPEGTPESETVQDILHWTRQTMAMMYGLIGKAIEESGEMGHPRDYLNFFCLANREEVRKGDLIPIHPPHHSTQYWNSQMHRRFMVYVHSKLMIVDDEYLLIGTANINQRSMDGQRDTEIAIGCYQSNKDGHKSNPKDIHTYRMSLWYEHIGSYEELFQHPQTLQCVQRITSIGEQMWNIYSGETMVDMDGVHLVNYPINVSQNGNVDDLENGFEFPDTKAKVKGKRSIVLPSLFTT